MYNNKLRVYNSFMVNFMVTFCKTLRYLNSYITHDALMRMDYFFFVDVLYIILRRLRSSWTLRYDVEKIFDQICMYIIYIGTLTAYYINFDVVCGLALTLDTPTTSGM